jgi:membrane protease YdiL (CAAX protease family)
MAETETALFPMLLLAGVTLAWLLSSVLLWSVAAARLWQGRPILPFEPRPPAAASLSDILLAIGVFGLAGTLLAPLLLPGRPDADAAGNAVSRAVDRSDTMPSKDSDAKVESESASAIATEGETAKDAAAEMDASAETPTAESGHNADGEEQGGADAGETQLVPALLLQALASSIAMIAALGWIALRGLPLRWYGFLPKPIDLLIGAVGVLTLLPPLFLLQTVLVTFYQEYSHPLLDVLAQWRGWQVALAMFVCSSLVAPLTEEFFFRGLVQSWLQSLGREQPNPAAARPGSASAGQSDPEMPAGASSDPAGSAASGAPRSSSLISHASQARYWPIVVTSLIFALAHAGQGPAPISLFFLSLGLGYLYRQTGRIWAGIFVHMFLNGLTTTVALLSL